MGTGCSDYPGYLSKWLCKSDLSPKRLKSFGINTNSKAIKEKSKNAIDGHVMVGGLGFRKRIPTYSITKLKQEL